MKDKYVVACVGIGAITTLVSVAVGVAKVDGALIGSAAGIIGTIVGYAFGKLNSKT